MDTSRRRGPVIAWAIAAATLYGAVGLGAAVPAGADATGRRPDVDASGSAGSSNVPGPRAHSRARGNGPSADTVPSPDGPCRWPTPPPITPPMPYGDVDRDNRSGLIALAVPVAPIPPFRAVAPAADDIPVDFPGDMPTDVAPSGPPAAPPSAAPTPVPRAVTVRVAPPPPAALPAAAVVPPAATLPAAPAPPAPAPARPVGDVPSPAPVRLGYPDERLGFPDELRDADLAKVVSMALPGLAAMVGMTALGAAVGYRQAKAGYLLRAAGAGRFLQ